MEYLQKLSEQGKSPLQVIHLIFNRILFEEKDQSLEKLNYIKLNPDFVNEVKLYQKTNDIGVNNQYLLYKINEFLLIDNTSIKTAIIYLIVKSPKLMTITEYLLIRNSLNFDSLVPYTFKDFENFLNYNKQDYRINMFFYFYFQDIYDVLIENDHIYKEEYDKKLEYFLNKSVEYSNFL
ncbi:MULTISPECIES: hypothetical protein [Empedobacter]|uniref:hypothetical protein n=1 Tax=Empedobacter TaxID=59734 RepID=UPI002578B783|nr:MULTISPECIES: hypothetical protein [Empedobacter]MDM1043045.1 hypothetical protein [Empedobacter brevis]MDM1136988.1 hypothetical protein [Empedobacter sp. R750]